MKMDYGEEYDEYWKSPDRAGSHSFRDPDEILKQLRGLGSLGKTLDIGCGMGLLVKTLNEQGVETWGIDVSTEAIKSCNGLVPGKFMVGSALNLPFENDSFDTVISTDCMEHLREEDVERVVAEIFRVAKGKVYLRIATRPDRDKRWHLTVKPKHWWESKFFEGGFRKDPNYQVITPYEALENESLEAVIVLEKIPRKALEEFPLSCLKEERSLHMDMHRESGRRSDAHIARYELARRYLRPEMNVLDAACGLGYGTALMSNAEQTAKVIGIDNSDYAIRYSKTNFCPTYSNVHYEKADVTRLRNLKDESFDFITSFETIEHLKKPARFLSEARRVLKSSGRFLCSVPNQWVDETGKDPNPWHFHVFDYPKLIELVSRNFKPIALFAQTAGNGMKFPDEPRSMKEVSLEEKEQWESTPAEWCLLLAEKRKLPEPKGMLKRLFGRTLGRGETDS